MHFNDLVTVRQSCRRYDPERKPSEATLLDVCRTALLAPSACNSQPWRVRLVQSPERVARIRAAFRFPFCGYVPAFAILTETKAVLKPFVLEKFPDGRRFSEIDLGILAAHLTLAAADRGLGSCILGMFDEELLRRELEIPQDEGIRLCVALGFPAAEESIRPKVRKDPEETLIVC